MAFGRCRKCRGGTPRGERPLARSGGACRAARARRLRNSAFRRSAFLFSFVIASRRRSNPGSVPHRLWIASSLTLLAMTRLYPRVIVTAPVPPPAPSDEDHARLFVCSLGRRHGSGAKARRENICALPLVPAAGDFPEMLGLATTPPYPDLHLGSAHLSFLPITRYKPGRPRWRPARARRRHTGRVAEWFKAPVLKTGRGSAPSWVRIPPLPPHAGCPARRHGLRNVPKTWVTISCRTDCRWSARSSAPGRCSRDHSA